MPFYKVGGKKKMVFEPIYRPLLQGYQAITVIRDDSRRQAYQRILEAAGAQGLWDIIEPTDLNAHTEVAGKNYVLLMDNRQFYSYESFRAMQNFISKIKTIVQCIECTYFVTICNMKKYHGAYGSSREDPNDVIITGVYNVDPPPQEAINQLEDITVEEV
jgi:hypothetical protein